MPGSILPLVNDTAEVEETVAQVEYSLLSGEALRFAQTMPYKYDIFLSYKRDLETLSWIRKHFLPLLTLRVQLELGREPKVYVHEVTQQIDAGTTWPVALGKELAASRVLVPLWTKTYFNSVWCTQELSHMLARERETKCRTGANEYGLVVPAIIHDGSEFPTDLADIQRIEIQSCYNTRMREDSPLAEKLSDLLAIHAPGVARAIEHAPKWRVEWPMAGAKIFFKTYYQAQPPSQKRIPRFHRP